MNNIKQREASLGSPATAPMHIPLTTKKPASCRSLMGIPADIVRERNQDRA